jgi:hypothetical protein
MKRHVSYLFVTLHCEALEDVGDENIDKIVHNGSPWPTPMFISMRSSQ